MPNKYISENEPMAAQCRVPWTSLYVDHCGKVMSCCGSNIILGNLNNEELSNMLNNKRAVKFRHCLKHGDYRYCQPICPLNSNPRYGFSPAMVAGYWDKFRFDFKQSPRVAIRKGLRKLNQLL
jgi:hypothetical protein